MSTRFDSPFKLWWCEESGCVEWRKSCLLSWKTISVLNVRLRMFNESSLGRWYLSFSSRSYADGCSWILKSIFSSFVLPAQNVNSRRTEDEGRRRAEERKGENGSSCLSSRTSRNGKDKRRIQKVVFPRRQYVIFSWFLANF